VSAYLRMLRIIKNDWLSRLLEPRHGGRRSKLGDCLTCRGDLAMCLNDLGVGETAVVCALDGGARFRSRMASFGFTPGVSVKMMQNYGRGAIIVSLRGTRVALGQGEACKVGVTRPQ
jgi:ferrous iron transport protein A